MIVVQHCTSQQLLAMFYGTILDVVNNQKSKNNDFVPFDFTITADAVMLFESQHCTHLTIISSISRLVCFNMGPQLNDLSIYDETLADITLFFTLISQQMKNCPILLYLVSSRFEGLLFTWPMFTPLLISL